LNPADSLVDWVLNIVPTMGAGWCPPGILGIGVGGTAEKAMVLAKEVLNDPVDIQDLMKRGPSSRSEELRLELYEKVNGLGIGAQGLGGLTTVLDVKISDYPTHIACLPVAMIPNCASTRHIHFHLDGQGAAEFEAPSMSHWPDIKWEGGSSAVRLNVDTMTQASLAKLTAGETVLLSGKILTGRDAAHKRLRDMAEKGEPMPADFHGRLIYYVGPVKAVRDEVIGPAGPTTATRMDKFTDFMLSDTIGVAGMIGKSERGPATIKALKAKGAVYFMAVGGAAYLISKAIKSSKLIAFEDLGPEAIYEFEVEDMPVTVAVDSHGVSVHETGPAKWRSKIGLIPVKLA
jgi:fumarate hydratase class I